MTITGRPLPMSAYIPFLFTSPLAIVVVLSIVIGLLMIVLFGYTSDQKAIKVAKDQLKAHLLAVRLFRDQLPVVMGSYGKILRGTGRYLKLAFKPLLYVIIPITLLIVQLLTSVPGHVHPAPLIDTSVRPAGTVSVTVTVPVVGPAPAWFETVTV